MSKGFIFTMDAILALIPLFIVLASVSALSSGTSLFIQGYILGSERMAQDVLATLDYRGALESTNVTELNQTLEKLIPSYFNYNYTSSNLNGTEKFSIARGNIANAMDIMIAKRIGTVSSGYVAVVMPNIFARTIEDINQDKADALNSILYALLGIDEIDVENPGSNDVTKEEWESIGRVTPTLTNLSVWWSTNNTLGYLVDRLIDEANAQGEANAVSGLTKFRSQLSGVANGTTTIANLKYDINDILNADLSTNEIANMGASASDVLLAASQSANAEREGLNPSYQAITVIKGNSKKKGGTWYDYEMNLTINIRISTQIAALSVGKTFYASEASVNLSVFEIVQGTGVVNDNANISYNITSKPSFNITNIYEQGAQIRIDRPHSIGYSVDNTGQINASVVYGSTTTAVFDQEDKNFARIDFQGVPIQEDENDIFKAASGDLNQGNNYRNARELAKDGNLEELFKLLLFDKNGDKKRGYVTVSDAGEVTKETLVTLKLWRE